MIIVTVIIMMIMIIIMMLIIVMMRSPPAPVEPWLRGTRRPAGKQTGPAAAAANIQDFGIFHFFKVFCICQTFNILDWEEDLNLEGGWELRTWPREES